MKLTTQELEQMRSVDIGAVAAESLPDVSGMTFDNALSRKERIPIFLPTNSLPESSPFVQHFIALKFEIFLCDFSAACRNFLYRFSWQTENICQCAQTVCCSLSVRNSASQ